MFGAPIANETACNATVAPVTREAGNRTPSTQTQEYGRRAVSERAEEGEEEAC